MDTQTTIQVAAFTCGPYDEEPHHRPDYIMHLVPTDKSLHFPKQRHKPNVLVNIGRGSIEELNTLVGFFTASPGCLTLKDLDKYDQVYTPKGWLAEEVHKANYTFTPAAIPDPPFPPPISGFPRLGSLEEHPAYLMFQDWHQGIGWVLTLDITVPIPEELQEPHGSRYTQVGVCVRAKDLGKLDKSSQDFSGPHLGG